MTENRNKKIVLINILIVLLEIAGLYFAWKACGITMFKYYTQDSNIILMITCIINIVFLLKGKEIPKWLKTFKYVATCLVTVTFMVVIFVLIPLALPGEFMHYLTGESEIFHHVLCPILAMITYIFIEKQEAPSKKEVTVAVIPTFTYAIITIILNVLGVLRGPYSFLMVENWTP